MGRPMGKPMGVTRFRLLRVAVVALLAFGFRVSEGSFVVAPVGGGRGLGPSRRGIALTATVPDVADSEFTETAAVTKVVIPPAAPSSTTSESDDLWLAAGRALDIAGVLGRLVPPLLLSAAVHYSNRDEVHHEVHGDGDGDGDGDFWSKCFVEGGPSNGARLSLALEELGPTFVKFGQALGSRPDVIPPSLASCLSVLQDDMKPFDLPMIVSTTTTNETKTKTLFLNGAVDFDVNLHPDLNLPSRPVAAASIGQVYRATLSPLTGSELSSTKRDVAVKVRRPGIREVVERDAVLLRSLAKAIQSTGLIRTDLVGSVDEFVSRLFEELDYRREARNLETFGRIYDSRRRHSSQSRTRRFFRNWRRRLGNDDVQVVVPKVLSEYCTDNVLVMEWVEGTKLTTVQWGDYKDNDANINDDDDDGNDRQRRDNLALVRVAIDSTLHQLLVTGTMHADPHAGNLLRVALVDNHHKKAKPGLGYLDLGLLSSIDQSVRDGLICAVAVLVFRKDVDAVAGLFGELQLIPDDVLEDPVVRTELASELESVLWRCLSYGDNDNNNVNNSNKDSTSIPKLKFDKLLDGLSRLIPRFRFRLPPYFLNNARALGTLEGIARSLDPDFNVMEVLYPYTVRLLLQNPSGSPVVDSTLRSLVTDDDGERILPRRMWALVRDASLLSGVRRRKVVWDALRTPGGRRLARQAIMETVVAPTKRRSRHNRRRSR